MKCAECRGACCESMSIPAVHILAPTGDARRWVELHATARPGHLLEFEVRCTALTPESRCGIYEHRPLVCKLYEAGGKDCLETVRARRSPEDYQRIRDEGDPLTIHEGAA